jgi:hypothetical protein
MVVVMGIKKTLNMFPVSEQKITLNNQTTNNRKQNRATKTETEANLK